MTIPSTQAGMGGFGTKVNIESEKNIYKLSNNVFLYDNITYDINFIKKLSNLLNNGSKFIYSFIKEDDYYPELLKYVDNSLTELNTYLFFEKVKENNELQVNDTNDIINTQNIKENESEGYLNIKFNWNSNNKKTLNHKNIPILNETKKVRMNILNQLNSNESTKFCKSKNNISKEEMEIIKQFQKEKPFKVIMCDKNVGFMFISNENHKKLAFDHLNNNPTYSACKDRKSVV